MSDYLWNRTDPVDSEIAALERQLAPYAFDPKRRPLRLGRRWTGVAAPVAAAAAVAFIAWQITPDRAPARATIWTLNESRVYTGQPIRAHSSAVQLESSDFGQIELKPGAEARVVESSPGNERLELRRGALHALIWAPPGEFVVDTPSARAVDLGCQYDLTVDNNGDGYVAVQTGWVAFQWRGTESFIPSGAACRTTRRSGPGVPFYEDTSETFRSALQAWEAAPSSESLAKTLRSASDKDALSVWHLLTRVGADQRAFVYDRFVQLAPEARPVNRDRVVMADRGALDACWKALGLEDAEWWRGWKQQWRSR